MRVLVVGNGAREHALLCSLKKSPRVSDLFAAPGNAGMAGIADTVPISGSDVIELADFASKVNIDFTIVGPELPLTLGIVDEFRKRNLRIFGPTRAAAELEGSKVFAKKFMREHGIPTADFTVCDSVEAASDALDARGDRYPVVVKADGLAGGKGVIIAQDRAAADVAVQQMLVERAFGNAGERILLEDFLPGQELSFQVVVDGRHAIPLAAARDYKRAHDDDQGPNTGGMGAISPSRLFTPELGRTIMQTIVQPTVAGMAADARRFMGVLYCGLMITDAGPQLLEYNVRFGDPETQCVLPRLESDPMDLFLGAASGHLDEVKIGWKKVVSVAVVMASAGYPGKPETGKPIAGLDEAGQLPVSVFHAGTEARDGAVVTCAGRVLTVNACAPTKAKAIAAAYAAVDKIAFEGMHFRRDIGNEPAPAEAG